MVRIDCLCCVPIHEKDGKELAEGKKELHVMSHPGRGKLVILHLKKVKIAVNGEELQKAITNCVNV